MRQDGYPGRGGGLRAGARAPAGSHEGGLHGSRRHLLAGMAGLVAGAASTGVEAAPQSPAPRAPAIPRPDTGLDVSDALVRALARSRGGTLRLEPGRYLVSGVVLPPGTHLAGVPGATRLVAAGPGPMLIAEAGGPVWLEGLDLDGAGQTLQGETGLLLARGIAHLTLLDCALGGTPGTALRLERCGGRVEACRIERADTAIMAQDSSGLAILGNTVRDCANNGILVHRSAKGQDGTLVSGNRIERVGAAGGGLGWLGNGINVFQAAGVSVTNNVIRDCAFSFVRANAADAVLVLGNQCQGAGETGLYSEFGFEGAVLAHNQVWDAANGISVVNADKGGRLAAVTGNLVRRCRRRPVLEGEGLGYGYGLSVEADAAVTGNVVEDCETAGLTLGYGAYLRDIACTGNVVRGSPVGIEVTVAEAERGALVAMNVLSGCTAGAVVGMAWERVATADLVRQGADAPAGIVVTGNMVR